jgi:hypothetical protein
MEYEKERKLYWKIKMAYKFLKNRNDLHSSFYSQATSNLQCPIEKGLYGKARSPYHEYTRQ